MKIEQLKPGKYIVAVSGGVDSVVLLDLLTKNSDLELIVAHFNHGIRDDSGEDEELVKDLAKHHSLQFKAGYGKLGAEASEAEARARRYEFLNKVKKEFRANAIITAHHEDDLIETAILNILRGTGPQGMISLLSNKVASRPLLSVNKKQIYNYAKKKKLKWREDSSNEDEKYLRNYIRKNLVPRLTKSQRKSILANIDKVADSKDERVKLIATLSQQTFNEQGLARSVLSALPSVVANELIMDWFRESGLRDFNKPMINRVNILIRTGQQGSRHNLNAKFDLILTKSRAKLTNKL